MRTSAVQALIGPNEPDHARDPTTLRALATHRIAELEEDLLELKVFHNSLTPAVLLPPEVLCRIFSFHRGQHKAEELAHRRSKGSTSWIGITHVCRRWRDVAIDLPSLWSDLSFRYPAFTQIMLQRSKEVPLRIEHTFQENPSKDLKVVFIGPCHNQNGCSRSTCTPERKLQWLSQPWQGSSANLHPISESFPWPPLRNHRPVCPPTSLVDALHPSGGSTSVLPHRRYGNLCPLAPLR
jgi:hypothetical protein